MADNRLIVVDGITLPQPYVYQWSLQDISDSDSGRTEDVLFHKNRVGQKRRLQLGWRGKSTAETSAILNAFNPEYISVRYFDLLDNRYETRDFIVGDREGSVKLWWVGRHLIDVVSFNITEV